MSDATTRNSVFCAVCGEKLSAGSVTEAAGPNNSTIALQVIRGNKMGIQCLGVQLDHHVPVGYKYRDLAYSFGTLKSVIVKYVHESQDRLADRPSAIT
jgi:hypothetical protein